MFMKFSRQRGVGLVELMISLVIGMIVIAGSLGLVSSTFGANASQMKMSRLNNELRMAMSSITRDMRRAGYHNWTVTQLTTGIYTGSPQPAPIFVVTAGRNPVTQGVTVTPGSESVTVSYDENANSSYDATETFGFRYQNNTIETRTGAGTWSSIVDPAVVQITAFSITDLSPAAIQPTGAPTKVTLPVFSITITGRLLIDNSVVRTIQETVRLRNVILS